MAKYKTRIYKIWENMIQRCTNPKNKLWDKYGGRGISVCERWRNSDYFIQDTKEGYSDLLTLDRINNDGNYESSNCRWATRYTQSRNTSRNVRITYGGIVATLQDWGWITGVHEEIIRHRNKRKYPPAQCLGFEPLKRFKRAAPWQAILL